MQRFTIFLLLLYLTFTVWLYYPLRILGNNFMKADNKTPELIESYNLYKISSWLSWCQLEKKEYFSPLWAWGESLETITIKHAYWMTVFFAPKIFCWNMFTKISRCCQILNIWLYDGSKYGSLFQCGSMDDSPVHIHSGWGLKSRLKSLWYGNGNKECLDWKGLLGRRVYVTMTEPSQQWP